MISALNLTKLERPRIPEATILGENSREYIDEENTEKKEEILQ